MLKSRGWWWWVVAYRILVSAQGPLILGFLIWGLGVWGLGLTIMAEVSLTKSLMNCVLQMAIKEIGQHYYSTIPLSTIYLSMHDHNTDM